MDDVRLAALLCARLCHELVSPVAAIKNGLDLVQEDSDFRDQAMELLAGNASEAARRLEFLRSAYGSGEGSAGGQTFADARRLLEAYFDGHKCTLVEVPEGTSAAPEGFVRLALNMVLTMCEALPLGGEVRVRLVENERGAGLTVEGKGPTSKVDERTHRCLANEIDLQDVDARGVQPLFTARLASALAGRVQVETKAEGTVLLAFVPD